jgi:hypothetical protein
MRLLPAQFSVFFIDAWRSSLLPVLQQILPVHLTGAIRHMRFMLMAGHDEAYTMEAVESTMEGLRGFEGLRRLELNFRTRARLEYKERFITYIKDWKTEESLLECVLCGGHEVRRLASCGEMASVMQSRWISWNLVNTGNIRRGMRMVGLHICNKDDRSI